MSHQNSPSGEQAPRGQASPRDLAVSIMLWIAAGVMVLLLVALVYRFYPDLPFLKQADPTAIPATPEPTPEKTGSGEPVAIAALNQKAVVRALNPHTELPNTGRKEAITYTVGDGDSLFALSKQFDLEPETIFWANYDALGGSPDMISPGIELVIPPADGVYYKWKEGDTFQSVADEFKADPEAILEAPINKFDLTNPVAQVDSYVMIPGGKREAVAWFQGEIPRGSAGTLSRLLGEGGCDTSAGGAFGDGSFGSPLPGGVVIGNDYIGGVHQGVDYGSSSSASIVAADDGVVVYSGWANGGYGYTVMIDHGNGFQTLYAHMQYTTVSCGASVYQGTQIGVVGSTGNSTGPHLHFEIRYMGLNDNPHNYL